ncbi:MAG: isoleucine--tRNA ligase, partial [Planctomycetia bacterium]
MFRPVESSVSFPKLEEKIIEFWKKHRIYEKSLEARQGCEEFIFYEGPPTANGLPHPGHCLTRSIKDIFPRYQTMKGRICHRKAGWDTHGLPVEVEVCKELGIHSKEEIEEYGVEPFIHKCLESVFRYTKQWEDMTERLGFWIHLDEAYVTYHQSYVESVWWALKNLFDRGLLYQGHKIVWWWAQGGTALSSGEVGQGYREVADPSVYVRFPLVGEDGDLADTDLLVWTTTPWTLPSNHFAAVDPYLEYAIVSFEDEDRKVIIAKALVESIGEKIKKQIIQTPRIISGKDLIGKRYIPPFDYFYKTLGNVTRDLYQPSEGEEWANYPYLYAVNVLHLNDEDIKEFLQQPRPIGWHILSADFVTTDSGTGIVHIAPAFGEDDFKLLEKEKELFGPHEDIPPLLCPVGPNGSFTDEVPDYKGRWVKEADKDLCRQLREEGTLFHLDQYLHEYPFCWRAEQDPLIQYPRQSWFIRTTRFKDQMLANNSQINWLPDHIKDGRMGNFLESNVDWALSRERYWGTPLPIWRCEETGHLEAVGNYAELMAKPGVTGMEVWEEAKKKNPDLCDDLKIHKPYIDEITYDSPAKPGARMRRVTEVIDCWFDSGAMPFAQWGYPAAEGSEAKFRNQFPADFISEALDQTRGWFYSLMAISTMLFGRVPDTVEDIMNSPEEEKDEKIGKLVKGVQEGTETKIRHAEALSKPTESTHVYPHPFKNCIVLGLMLGEDGQKMSKSKRNYREPNAIFDKYGADALRWYLYANQPPWTSIRYNEQSIKECIPEFLLRLWNCYSFFVIYANIDGFDPAKSFTGSAAGLTPDVLAGMDGYRPVEKRAEIDRWVLSELHRATVAVTDAMDAYDNYGACSRLSEFVDALSNWYVRSCRDRFWSGEMTDDKADAYWTLYECLLTTAKLIAPFTPFLAEELWQNLAVAPFEKDVLESVHLCDFPAGDPAVIDEELSEQMALAREIVSLGRSARMGAKLKVRQPLAKVEMILADAKHADWLMRHESLICDELNVKSAEIAKDPEQYISYTVLPDLKKLGPK